MTHVLMWGRDSEAELLSEIQDALPGARVARHASSVLVLDLPGEGDCSLPQLAFARQCLPNAFPVRAASIRDWSAAVVEAAINRLPVDSPWFLDIQPHYGEASTRRIGARAWHSLTRAAGSTRHRIEEPLAASINPAAGRRRSELIRQAVVEALKKRNRLLLKCLRTAPQVFGPGDSSVQVLLVSPNEGFVSVCPAPLPSQLEHLVSPFPAGHVEVPPDPGAPSRAFAKLVESEIRMGMQIRSGETCVDLGAAPGSWTYVAAQRGAKVIAVDRSPLRADLVNHKNVSFVAHDAFTFKPGHAVDWLLCDVIAEPDRSAGLLLKWLSEGWCGRFVVTLKLKGGPALETLRKVKAEIPGYSRRWHLKKLSSNKKELCVFGVVGRNA